MTPDIFDKPVPLAEYGRTHMIGVGGAGMSVIARLLAARGLPVSGSDAVASETLEQLRADNINVSAPHDASLVAADGLPVVDTVVVSSAVRESNPELTAARAANLRILHRSHALASLMADERCVAVAGAHGKTTTSAMVVAVLRACGLDPSFAIGGSVIVADPTGEGASGVHTPGGHLGGSSVLVAEADESDGSFLDYHPDIAVVTNVEPDHLDHYGSEAAFAEAFEQFAANIRPGGYLVACADDDGASRLAASHRACGGQVITYGTDPDADIVIIPAADGAPLRALFTLSLNALSANGTDPGADVMIAPAADGAETRATLSGPLPNAAATISTAGPGASAVSGPVLGAATLSGPALGPDPVQLELQVAGLHNLRNAAAAVIVAALLLPGSEHQAAAGANGFLGTGRRFEFRGTAGGVRVYDDYAHHPTEIEALLAGARQVAGDGRVLVLFQPHLYSRTVNFAARFAAALEAADQAFITGVYRAREDFNRDVGAHTIVEAARDTAPQLHAVEDKHAAVVAIADAARPGDVVITVGAGDVTELAPEILAQLSARA